MLCSTELMQPELVSSTGETLQAGMTCGGTLTAGFDGGRMPLAPAGAAAPATTIKADPKMAATAVAARAIDAEMPRASPLCVITLPAPSFAEMDQPGQRTFFEHWLQGVGA
jgi:hypothetical protein